MHSYNLFLVFCSSPGVCTLYMCIIYIAPHSPIIYNIIVSTLTTSVNSLPTNEAYAASRTCHKAAVSRFRCGCDVLSLLSLRTSTSCLTSRSSIVSASADLVMYHKQIYRYIIAIYVAIQNIMIPSGMHNIGASTQISRRCMRQPRSRASVDQSCGGTS